MDRDQVIADFIKYGNGLVDEIDEMRRQLQRLREDNVRLRQALGEQEKTPHNRAVLATTEMELF